jgi:hypothetical protein
MKVADDQEINVAARYLLCLRNTPISLLCHHCSLLYGVGVVSRFTFTWAKLLCSLVGVDGWANSGFSSLNLLDKPGKLIICLRLLSFLLGSGAIRYNPIGGNSASTAQVPPAGPTMGQV